VSPLGWTILLFLLGLVFLGLEFFVPSGGSLAAMCALAFLAAIAVGFMADRWTGVIVLLAVCVVVPTAAGVAVRWWPDTPIGRLMLIQRPRTSDDVLPETPSYRGFKDLVGRRGQARGLMVPSGSVIIDGKTYDAISEGMPIEALQPVIVVSVSTQRLIVRPDHTLRADVVEPDDVAAASSNQPLVPDIPDPFAET
jgi:membrane-bound ClpP family serine protease